MAARSRQDAVVTGAVGGVGHAVALALGRPRTLGVILPAALIGTLTVYLAFRSGGYFPGASSVAALVLAAALVLRVLLAEDPLEGLSRPLAVASAALLLYGVWALVSAAWSDSFARALIEFNRVLLYLLALLLFGSMRHVAERLRWMVWSLAAAFTAVCAAGLLTRTLPDVFTIQPSVQAERLSYPIEYWNALGIAAALGIVLCTHLTTSKREPSAARALGAAALPVLAVTLLFTFSRGPLAMAVIGVATYLVIARPRALRAGALAAGPATALALLAAYRADLLASKEPTTQAAAAQGHEVALAVAICVLIATTARVACLRNGDRVPRRKLRPDEKRRLIAGTAAAVVLVGVFVLAATDFTDRIDAQLDRFGRSDVRQTGDYRDRLTNPGINRLDHWKISLNAFGAAPLGGQGAGTFALLWDRERPTNADSEEGHSLYLEALGELGLVGAVLLAAFFLALLAGVARRVRGPDRSLYVAVLAASLMWVLHAGIDWDWEVAAVTLWLPALAGAAASSAPLAAPARARAEPRGPRPLARAGLAAGVIALAGTPGLVAASQARLLQSLDAYEKGDCDTAGARALDSIAVLGSRPEPYEVIGYCNARSGSTREAEEAMRAAVERDPANWGYRYGLALVRSAGGRDPRAAAREALRLNPNEPAARYLVARTRTADPDRWRRAAEQLGRTAPSARR